ncbi:LacI family transcriptional regulator [Oleiharenicola lentus]|uniref:LacI family transcriptional regulator n=1 Tax=Oleiharenicola lentus TaxID=2508720 RepID=A0A4Q1CBG8_9BACT|nr:LacI family DNA-binding transcriptional regulator [Oleiharenicola lentus]RXK56348.1 LacI family transcriptional regulator [Oleiharenicola lentus]
MEQRPTMADIALRAGVHVSTVSRALNAQASVPTETRNRILSIATAMGYRIDPLTAALMRSRRLGRPASHKANLGFIVSESRKQAWRPRSWIWEVFGGAKEQAEHAGYSLEVFWAEHNESASAAFTRMLLARGIQGLILAPEHEAPLTFNLDWEKFAVISLHYGPSKVIPRFHQLVSNHFQSMIQVCRRCRELGYERVGLVLRDHPDTHYEYGRLILGAYQAAMDEAHRLHAVPPHTVRELDPEDISVWARQHQVDAIVQAGGGYSAQFEPPALINRLRHHGYDIGGRQGLVIMAHRKEFDMAVVDERTEILGRTASRLLIEYIQQNQRGVPDDPIVFQLAGKYHDGMTLPRRTNSFLPLNNSRTVTHAHH